MKHVGHVKFSSLCIYDFGFIVYVEKLVAREKTVKILKSPSSLDTSYKDYI